jgi:hypothetical protein
MAITTLPRQDHSLPAPIAPARKPKHKTAVVLRFTAAPAAGRRHDPLRSAQEKPRAANNG